MIGLPKFGLKGSMGLSTTELLGAAVVGAAWVGALAFSGTPIGLMSLAHFAAASGITGGLWTGAKAAVLGTQTAVDRANVAYELKYDTEEYALEEEESDSYDFELTHEDVNKFNMQEKNDIYAALPQSVVNTFSAAYNYAIGNSYGKVKVPFSTRKEKEIQRNIPSYSYDEINNIPENALRSGKIRDRSMY